MRKEQNDPRIQKLSPEFAARLARLSPHQRIRAIVMLRTAETRRTGGRRQTRQERDAQIQAIAKSNESLLSKIDTILARHEGKRLSTKPDVLGCILVETTPAGIDVLAQSKHVQSIFEDQAISLVS
jgi:hypothetical protein